MGEELYCVGGTNMATFTKKFWDDVTNIKFFPEEPQKYYSLEYLDAASEHNLEEFDKMLKADPDLALQMRTIVVNLEDYKYLLPKFKGTGETRKNWVSFKLYDVIHDSSTKQTEDTVSRGYFVRNNETDKLLGFVAYTETDHNQAIVEDVLIFRFDLTHGVGNRIPEGDFKTCIKELLKTHLEVHWQVRNKNEPQPERYAQICRELNQEGYPSTVNPKQSLFVRFGSVVRDETHYVAHAKTVDHRDLRIVNNVFTSQWSFKYNAKFDTTLTLTINEFKKNKSGTCLDFANHMYVATPGVKKTAIMLAVFDINLITYDKIHAFVVFEINGVFWLCDAADKRWGLRCFGTLKDAIDSERAVHSRNVWGNSGKHYNVSAFSYIPDNGKYRYNDNEFFDALIINSSNAKKLY
jgi:hypothetical protein